MVMYNAMVRWTFTTHATLNSAKLLLAERMSTFHHQWRAQIYERTYDG